MTGGAATMTLTFEGKSFPICCTGCRDEFNESPQKYIKKASLLLSSQAANAKSTQSAAPRVSRFEDAFAGDVPAKTELGRMADRGNPATPDSKAKIEKSEPAARSAEVVTKGNSPAKTKNATNKTAATKSANRAAALLRIAQNLDKDGKTDAALKNLPADCQGFPRHTRRQDRRRPDQSAQCPLERLSDESHTTHPIHRAATSETS